MGAQGITVKSCQDIFRTAVSSIPLGLGGASISLLKHEEHTLNFFYMGNKKLKSFQDIRIIFIGATSQGLTETVS